MIQDSSVFVKSPKLVSLGAWVMGGFPFGKWNPEKADWLSSNVGIENYDIIRWHSSPYGWRITFAKKDDVIRYKLIWGDNAESEVSGY